MKRAAKTLILLLLFCAMVPIRGIKAQEQWPVIFWAALPEPDHSAMVEMIRQYNADNPYRPVEYTNFDSPEKLLEALEQRQPPTLALIDSRWIGTLQEKLVPAQEMMDQAGEMVATMSKADTFPSFWNAVTIGGKAYALPFSAETAALVLNRNVFSKFPATVPTIQAWGNLGGDLKTADKSIWRIVLPLQWSPDDLGQLWADFSETFTTPQHPVPGAAQEAATLNLWTNWADREKLSPASAAAVPSSFAGGSSWILLPREVESLGGDFAVKPLPKFKNPWGFMKVQAIAFFTRDNSWDFANYLTQYDQLKFWAMNTPTVPVNKQVYLSPDYLSQIDSNRKWMRIYIWAAVHAVPSYNFPNAPSVLGDIGVTVSKSVAGEMSEQEAGKEIQVLLNSVSRTEVP